MGNLPKLQQLSDGQAGLADHAGPPLSGCCFYAISEPFFQCSAWVVLITCALTLTDEPGPDSQYFLFGDTHRADNVLVQGISCLCAPTICSKDCIHPVRGHISAPREVPDPFCALHKQSLSHLTNAHRAGLPAKMTKTQLCLYKQSEV